MSKRIRHGSKRDRSESSEEESGKLAPKYKEKSEKLKQLDLFYRDPGGGKNVQREKPEDCVPDLPENQEVTFPDHH